MSDFKPGDIVLVSADADDVYFGGEVVGRVLEDPEIEFVQESYRDERRLLIEAKDTSGTRLTQFVRPEHLTILDKVDA